MGTAAVFIPRTTEHDYQIQNGQTHGAEGLYIADNSFIPTSGAANPTLTTVALAIRTADKLIAQFR